MTWFNFWHSTPALKFLVKAEKDSSASFDLFDCLVHNRCPVTICSCITCFSNFSTSLFPQILLTLTCRWPPCREWCHTSHHSGKSPLAGHRCSGTAGRPHWSSQGHTHTPPHRNTGSLYTWNTHCRPGICMGLPCHLENQTEPHKWQRLINCR